MAIPPCILVVHGTQEIVRPCRLLLEEEGYEVALLSYTPQELAEVERIHPDLIILDLISKDERVGLQLLNRLRLQQETAGIPVIVVTAATSALCKYKGHLKARDVTVVAKPYSKLRLYDLLLAAIEYSLAPTA